ncbi:fungal-specific transcription factor domain-containing protein [Ampelomyces quisqualis]|uniref:Fungal-specific transcription factor domain-containing protein n=1 Tax=Ampelomyces quisqualis TaxID=50730 RepID=A0A6A5Q9I7_AMPQU|nr:fungal-specific transcription factor domain-containing protein [Ampelomyces quisqualis]
MQHDWGHDPQAAPSGQQSKVAIPRLARPEQESSKSLPKHRDRVPRACRNCHKRKVKCSGGLPRCKLCEKVNKACVYDATRRDRLANATGRNGYLISLLRDLTGRVSNEDKARIESALNDSDDEDYSPEPSSAWSSRFQTAPFTQQSDLSRRPSGSQNSPLSAFYTPNTEGTSPIPESQPRSGHQESDYDNEVLFEDAAQDESTHGHSVLGQTSEVHWLQQLKARIRRRDNPTSTLSPPLNDTNFYLDDKVIQLPHGDNPFHLPSANLATVLFRGYFRTVHTTFPIVSADVEDDLQIYYDTVQSTPDVAYPHHWFAMVNLILAIGARFYHLIEAEWHAEIVDETVYVSRAYQLLGLNDTAITLAAPGLPLIQAFGLLAIYYTAIGHIDRAWVTVGSAIRLAIASGLHTQSHYSLLEPKQGQLIVDTWWSLHNLENLLSSMTGRSSMLHNEYVTTPLPSTAADYAQQSTAPTSSMAYPDAQIYLANLSQEILSNLYTERRSARSWPQIHAIMTAMQTELDDWAVEAIPDPLEGPQTHDAQHMMLKKQYCRVRILITRPSLRRIERCSETGSEEFTASDQDFAETCIQTAQDVAAPLPNDVDARLLYEKGPWWTVVHNSKVSPFAPDDTPWQQLTYYPKVMQALAILLIGVSCRPHFESLYHDSIASIRKLVAWLHSMRDANDTARRAYQVLYNIVKTPDTAVWSDVAGMFPDEQMTPFGPPVDPNVFLPWDAVEQPLHMPHEFGYEGDGYEAYRTMQG